MRVEGTALTGGNTHGAETAGVKGLTMDCDASQDVVAAEDRPVAGGDSAFHLEPSPGSGSKIRAMQAADTNTVKLALIKQPSGWIPLAMSFAAIVLVILVGVGHGQDDGREFIFQRLLTLQIPVMGFFLVKWVRERPRETFVVLALQAAAALIAMAPVYFLGF
jgi:hypothetical protein